MPENSSVATLIKKTLLECDGRTTLHCRDAFLIAEQLSVSPDIVGQICNEMGVKIVHCQLGCFK
jgi:hypothetical protein